MGLSLTGLGVTNIVARPHKMEQFVSLASQVSANKFVLGSTGI
jgi:hypothetical protein